LSNSGRGKVVNYYKKERKKKRLTVAVLCSMLNAQSPSPVPIRYHYRHINDE
jgi:hypothetical protein